MPKSKIFFIVATLAITLIGCSQAEEGTFLQGNVTEINPISGDVEVEIETWTTVSSTDSSPEASTKSYEVEKASSQTIRVSNPEDYEEGQKVKVKVIKNYNEDVWDINKLKFEVEEIN